MKEFLITVASIIVYSILSVFIFDFNLDLRQNFKLKYVAEECSATGSLFYDPVEYSEGKIVFNKDECKKAVEAQMQTLLKLDNSFEPLSNSYCKNKVTYKIYFYDDNNTDFSSAKLHRDKDTFYAVSMTCPTVVVTINAGKSIYRLKFLETHEDNIRSGAHSWEGR